jgi:phosphoribosylformimino-5-aminoimidazole carboxamide ribotide isomerase
MTNFRPCIDLHGGKVKQIVGGTLTDDGRGVVVNFVADQPAEYFASLYRRDSLTGGHVIMLGPGNEAAARSALAAWPGGLQIGGGITGENARAWLDAGASHAIVTSWLFSPAGAFLPDNLERLARQIGKSRIVIDLSCRRAPAGWTVCMNRWQTLTDLALDAETLGRLAGHCAEFLIHAADVEGRRSGMDEELISALAAWSPIPLTYAGGASSAADLAKVNDLSGGRIDLTIGSALDIFGGKMPYMQCVAWNHRTQANP